MGKIFLKYKKDFILIGTILILACGFFLVKNFTAKNGNTVKILIDGKEKYSYNLSKDKTQEILTGDNGVFSNTVVIKGGKVTVKSANCPDKICVKHRAISKKGETIVCLPHKLVVVIE